MADHRYQWEDAEWFCWGDSVSKASATTFKIATNVTSRYLVDRRIKLFDTGSIKYATIISSSYSAPDTTIGIEFDDNGSLGASFSSVALSIISPQNTSVPNNINQNKNLIINGQFRIGQRGLTFTAATTPANNDDTYILDRWTLLSDGNDIVDVSKESTTVPTGVEGAVLLDVETANKKFGVIQFIEHTDAKRIIDGKASLSFKARKGGSNATADTLRAALISWSSTADTLTSDVVSSWNSEGTNPTLVANWTYENTPSNLTLTTSYQTFKIENISIDTASTTNVALFIWCDNGDATVGDFIYISACKVNAGTVATSYEQEIVSKEIADCQRFFCKTFSLPTSPAEGVTVGRVMMTMQVANSNAATGFNWQFPVEMRVAPTITFYNPRAAGTDAQWDSGSASLGGASSDNIGTRGGLLFDSGVTAAVARWYIQATASAEL